MPGNYFITYKGNDGNNLFVEHEFVTRASAERYIRQHDQNTQWRILRDIGINLKPEKEYE